MTKKPIIGISTNLKKVEEGSFAGYDRVYLNKSYSDSILLAGGIPVLLPAAEKLEHVASQIEMIDGLILSGGQDVEPTHYREESHPLLGVTSPTRDHYELELLRMASQQGKPVLGICRGLQLMNVFFGGTLFQDLSQQEVSEKLEHNQEEDIAIGTHRVMIERGSLLHKIFGSEEVMANSLHHQAIKELAPGFVVAGTADDGTVEAIVKTEKPWMVGVQWHPEMMTEHDEAMLSLFRAFVNECLSKL